MNAPEADDMRKRIGRDASVPLVWADAELRETRYARVWVIPRCPFCGGVHEHGAGGLADDPLFYLGPRVSVCTGQEYVLRESPEPRTTKRYYGLNAYRRMLNKSPDLRRLRMYR